MTDAGADIAARRAAVALAPASAEAHYALGRVLLDQGHPEEAVASFERARTIKPDDAETWYRLGYALSLLGRLDEARAGCLQAIALDPRHAEAHTNVGYTYFCAGQWEEALRYFSAAVGIRPDYARAHYNRGLCLFNLGRSGEAAEAFRRTLELQPGLAEAYYQLAQAQAASGNLDEAVAALRQVVRLQPGHAPACHQLGKLCGLRNDLGEADAWLRRAAELAPDNASVIGDLGILHMRLGNPREALACHRAALALAPDDADRHYNVGHALIESGEAEAAIASFERARALRPDFANAYVGLGNATMYLYRPTEAILHFQQALELGAEPATVYANLGIAHQHLGQAEEAARLYAKAIELDPDNAQLYHNLGTIWSKQGRLDRALECFEHAVRLRPDFVLAYDSALLCGLYDEDLARGDDRLSARGYAQSFEQPLRSDWSAHEPRGGRERRLRIGYVSPDFRQHSVAHFIEPILEHHDRGAVEVYCYYNQGTRDEVTERLRRHADHWMDCTGVPDDELAARIRADGIDVLVDLAGHTGGNRLLTFARKPAPVQVSYLGYPATTGLSAMDWRLVTADTDPPDSAEWHSERLYRLPRSLWCYRPADDSSQLASETPAIDAGRVTFGSMNNIAKVSDAAVAAWARILLGLPDAQLAMTGLTDGAQKLMRERFAAHGIDVRRRLRLYGRLAPRAFHELLNGIDIALDSFPYSGTTTTCECLWMGVPVVTKLGETSVSRSGYALLKGLGLEELAVRDPDEYVRLALELARDLPRLSALRASLRPRMQDSALRDEAGMARDLESAYRRMWDEWRRTPAHQGRSSSPA